MHEADPTPSGQLDSIKDVERLLLDAANAIQRLISERDALRQRVEVLESELARLRERTSLIHDSYQRLANEFNTQLQLLGNGFNDLFGDPTQSSGARPEQPQAAGAANSDSL